MALLRRQDDVAILAKQNFLLGERSLRAYAAGGNVRFLQDAKANLSAVGPTDRNHGRAQFYLGVALTQLRETTKSVEIFRGLQESKRMFSDANFQNQVALQLAYAQIKTYTQEGYDGAEAELNRLHEIAVAEERDKVLLVQTLSLQAFLYAVKAGRDQNKPARPQYARRALEVVDKLLTSPVSNTEARFEALNALGITWMRVGEGTRLPEDDSVGQAWRKEFSSEPDAWRKGEQAFAQALLIVPNSVRVFQNIATMKLLQFDCDVDNPDRAHFLKEGKEALLLSLDVNDQDQFPYYRLAQFAVREEDREGAFTFIRVGKTRPGAVKEKEWREVEAGASAL
jgi:hypothetical protein